MNRRNLGIAADIFTVIAGIVLALWFLGADVPLDIRL